MPIWEHPGQNLPRFHAEAGVRFHRQGDLENALRHYTRALECADIPGLLALRGWLHYQRGDRAQALADLNRELELGPPDARTFEYRAWVKLQSDDLEGALADYSRLVQLQPQESRVYSLRGSAQAAAGRMDRALDDCTYAIEIDSRSAEAYLARANVWNRRGEPGRSQEDVDRALVLDPKSAGAHHLRGSLFLGEGGLDLARACYETACRLGGNGGWSEYGLGILHQIRGEWNDSMPRLESALVAAWGDPALRDYAAMHVWIAEQRTGASVPADRRLSDFLGTRPPPPTGDWSGALAEYLLGRRSEAALTDSLRPLPEWIRRERSAQLSYYSGLLRLHADDEPGAMQHFRRCVDSGARHFFEWSLARAELG